MRATAKKWGNSASVRIPSAVMPTQVKGYPFEVTIAGARPGAALADQVKSLDWVVHKSRYKGQISTAELREVRAKIAALVGSTS